MKWNLRSGESVSHWRTKTYLALSLQKCNSMVASTREKLSQVQQIDVQISNSSIPCVTTSKILGVHFDNVFSWEDQVKHVHKKDCKEFVFVCTTNETFSSSSRKKTL